MSVESLRPDDLPSIKELLISGDVAKLEHHQDILSEQLDEATLQHVSERINEIDVDKISMALLPPNSVETSDGYIPTALKTGANGDCMYKAASILLVGDDDLASLIRVLVSLELFLNKHYYADHPFIDEKQKLASDHDVFSKCLRNSSTLSVKNTEKSHVECVRQESIGNCKAREWSSMMCLLALSSVLKSPIKSIYPKTSTVYNEIFNGVIYPRNESSLEMKHIMWSKTPSLQKSLGGAFQSNHFVPIVIRSKSAKSPLVKKRKITAPTSTTPQQKQTESILQILPPMKFNKAPITSAVSGKKVHKTARSSVTIKDFMHPRSASSTSSIKPTTPLTTISTAIPSSSTVSHATSSVSVKSLPSAATTTMHDSFGSDIPQRELDGDLSDSATSELNTGSAASKMNPPSNSPSDSNHSGFIASSLDFSASTTSESSVIDFAASKLNPSDYTTSTISSSVEASELNPSASAAPELKSTTSELNASGREFSDQTNPDMHDMFDRLSSLTDKEIFDLIKCTRPPEKDFIFPKSGSRNSSCQIKWFTEHKWLVYSKSVDALYCLCCCLFPAHGGQTPKLCTKEGLRSFASATKKIANHKDSAAHQLSSNKLMAFCANRKDPSKAVNSLWSKHEVDLIKKNRSRLITVIKCVLYLGKQGLPFRGHREDGEHLNDPNTNPGNFKALLQLLEDVGNPEVTYLLKDAPKNAKYTSKTICDQIIDVIGESVLSQLVADVKKAKFFSILADEAQDISNKEQMALVLRFVDEKNEVREEFIKFAQCDKGLSGEALSKLILEEIEGLGLSMTNCRGQGYDGAGAMAGSQKGAATRITKLFPKVIYFHCFAHMLNLSVMKIITVKVVRNMFDDCRVISDFFNNSAKRYQRFAEIITASLGRDVINKLIDICRTRWIERIDGLSRFKEAYELTYKSLRTISSNETLHGTDWNSETRTTAVGLVKVMEKFDFIVALVVAKEVLEYMHALTVSLQSSTLAIVEAYQSVSTVVETLRSIRVNVDSHHDKWYEEAVKIAKSINVSPQTPRTCAFQKFRSNVPADTSSDYFKRTITIPVLDEIIGDLRVRFSPENLAIIDGFYCVPSIMNKYPNEWKRNLLKFMKKYEQDMPNFGSCEAEIDCWQTFWFTEYKGEFPDTVDKTLKSTMISMYPNIHTVLLLLGTIPVTTCSCERCISVLRRLKTYLRSRMTQDRLNDLATLQIHYGMKIDTEEILDRLIVKYPKRVKMRNILYDE